MDKVRLGPNVFIYPMPMALAGVLVKGKPNFMALAWVSRVNFKPPMLAAAINRTHYTCAGIKEAGAFSINIPSRQLLKKTDYCGIASGKNVDKAGLFEVFYGTLKNVPMIKECPLSMECRLVDEKELPTNTLFIAEIVSAYSEARYLTKAQPDIKKMDPFVLTMPDNRYWAVGECVGQAWKNGESL